MKKILFIFLLLPFVTLAQLDQIEWTEIDGIEVVTRDVYEIAIEPNLIDNLGFIETQLMIIQEENELLEQQNLQLQLDLKNLSEKADKYKNIAIEKYNELSKRIDMSLSENISQKEVGLTAEQKIIVNKITDKSIDELKKEFTVKEFKIMLGMLNLKKSGLETTLAKRLSEHINQL